MTDSDYADNLLHHANTSAKAEFLLHNLTQAAGSIGFDVKSNKIEYMCFKQKGVIFKPLKLVNQFTYLRNNISSTESVINISKMLTAIDRLISDKIKRDFFKLWSVSTTV